MYGMVTRLCVLQVVVPDTKVATFEATDVQNNSTEASGKLRIRSLQGIILTFFIFY